VSAEFDRPLALGAWLDRLSTLLSASAPQVTPAEQAAILDLARIAAHASERIAAPISTYLVGLAFASLVPRERAGALREIVTRLESVSDP
jgi:Domain of unknown function (DUF6457)